MSIRDLIWMNVGLSLKKHDRLKAEYSFRNTLVKQLDHLQIAMCDLRTVLLDSNNHLRLIAYKGTERKVIPAFPVKDLPSSIIEAKRREEARRARMSPEDRAAADLRDFLDGKVIQL